MGKRYTKEKRLEALKPANKIGSAAAARQLGLNVDTLYGCRGRNKERASALEAAVAGRSEGELAIKIEALRKQLKQAQKDVDILQEVPGFSSSAGNREPSREHQFIPAHPGRWPVSAMRRVLHLSEQGYYRFLRHPERGQRDGQLLEQIYDCPRGNEENGENYEVQRIIGWLRLYRGYGDGSRRIHRICREYRLTIRRQRCPNGLTKAGRQTEKSENLIKRDFAAAKPNQWGKFPTSHGPGRQGLCVLSSPAFSGE